MTCDLHNELIVQSSKEGKKLKPTPIDLTN